MGLETGTYIDSLVATNPTGGDDRSTADDHLRLIKSTILNTFPNLTGAMSASQTELNFLVGQDQAVGTNDSPTFAGLTCAGTINFTGATISNLGSITTADINGGTIDGVTIGGAAAGAGTFTTLTATGAFTSVGIDDNATAERLEITDTSVVLGGGNDVAIVGAVNTKSTSISGGFGTASGANIYLIGGDTGPSSNDFYLRAGASNVIAYDHSASQLLLSATSTTIGSSSQFGNALTVNEPTGDVSLLVRSEDGTAQLFLNSQQAVTGNEYRIISQGSTGDFYIYDTNEVEEIIRYNTGVGGSWELKAEGTTRLTVAAATTTVANALTVQGAFTSVGIDDNATGTRLLLADVLLSLGVAGAGYNVGHAAADQSLHISGSSSTGAGGNLLMYGGSHATQASDFQLRANTTVVIDYDHSATTLDFAADTRTFSNSAGTEQARFNSSGNLLIGTTTANGFVAIDQGAASGSTLSLDRTSNPGSLRLMYSGTETGQLQALSGGGLALFTGSTPTERMRITNGGNLLIGTTTDVTGGSGSIKAAGSVQAVHPTNKNVIINGSFEIWQRGASFTATNNVYNADRWLYSVAGTPTAVFSVLQAADRPSPSATDVGVYANYCLHYDCTTADASIAAGDAALINHYVEAQNSARFGFGNSAPDSVTLSFWHKHTKTGTHCVHIRSSTSDRSYIAEYTQAVTDTWEKAEIVIPACPDGTWNKTSGIGMNIGFVLFAGSNWQDSAGSWLSANKFATSNQVNNADNVANNFKIALVQLEAGEVATTFEGRDYGTELALCQRYYERMDDGGGNHYWSIGYCPQSTLAYGIWHFKQKKRTIPTVTITNATTAFSISGTSIYACTNVAPASTKSESVFISCTSSGMTANAGVSLWFESGQGGVFHADAEL